jgi:hypothetical protein
MKFTAFSKTMSKIGSTAVLTTLVGTTLQPTAQAVFSVSGQYNMPCSDVFFNHPNYMYTDPQSNITPTPRLSFDSAPYDAIDAAVTTFAVDLDAPIGYTPNKVNGVAVEIPPEIEREMQVGMSYPYSREKVRMLNEQYGQYATFGQQITLIYSSEQVQQMDALLKNENARLAALLTPEERRAEQEVWRSSGACPVGNIVGFAGMGIFATKVIEVGVRPDLDARLREDTTGATFFR